MIGKEGERREGNEQTASWKKEEKGGGKGEAKGRARRKRIKMCGNLIKSPASTLKGK